jgi:hypothetical protein
MSEQRVSIRNQALHIMLQVGAHLWIGILAKDKGGAGMVDKHVAQSGLHTRSAYPLLHRLGNQTGAAARGCDSEAVLKNHLLHPPLTAATSVVDIHDGDELLQHRAALRRGKIRHLRKFLIVPQCTDIVMDPVAALMTQGFDASIYLSGANWHDIPSDCKYID